MTSTPVSVPRSGIPAAAVMHAIGGLLDTGLPVPHHIDHLSAPGLLPEVQLPSDRSAAAILAWARAIDVVHITLKSLSSSRWALVHVTGVAPSGAMLMVSDLVKSNLLPELEEGQVRQITLAELESLAVAR